MTLSCIIMKNGQTYTLFFISKQTEAGENLGKSEATP